MQRIIVIVLLLISSSSFAQRGSEVKPGADPKRKASRMEIRFLANKVDSIRNNLSRMIRFEKELRQRNYYLNEKSALVDELVSILRSLENSVEVVEYTDEDMKRIFGKKRLVVPGSVIYQVETYKANCAFMEITVFVKDGKVMNIAHRVTDCERLK